MHRVGLLALIPFIGLSLQVQADEQMFRSYLSSPIFFSADGGGAESLSLHIERDHWRYDENISIPVEVDGAGDVVLVGAPDGWSYTDGEISGPLGSAGPVSFEVRLVVEGDVVGSVPVDITVIDDLVAIAPGDVEVAAQEEFSAAANVENLLGAGKWSFTDGDVPTWLHLDEDTGGISGVAPETSVLIEGLVLTVVDQIDHSDASTEPFSVIVQAVVMGEDIRGWGLDDLSGVPAGESFTAISGGYGTVYALRSDGSIAAWGRSSSGQLNVPEGDDFIAVAAGNEHAYGLRSDGTIVAWGKNDQGQVSQTPSGDDFVSIFGGDQAGYAIRRDGSIIGWGSNAGGVTNVPSGNDFVSVSAGAAHAYALKQDGSIVGWGSNDSNRISGIPSGNDFVAVAAGHAHGFALKQDGSIVGWGYNNYKEIDNIPSGNDFVAIASGDNHGIALKQDGSIVVWGRNSEGQVSERPSGNGFLGISAGGRHGYAMR